MSESQTGPDIKWDVFEFIHAHQTAEKGMAVDLMNEFHERVEKLQIELEMVRKQVTGLFSGQYMPTPEAVIDALWANETVVDEIYRARVERMKL
jgi:hypothetical protein